MQKETGLRSRQLTKILDYVFPDVDRTFPGLRWVNIILRTIHLVGITGVGGGLLYDSQQEYWMPYLGLTVVSGFMMMSLSIWSNGMWLLQVRGITLLVKLCLLGLFMISGNDASVIIIVVIISGVIAHAPGKVRYYKVFRGPKFLT